MTTITMSTDAYTQMTNDFNTVSQELREEKKKVKELIEAGEKSVKWNEERYNDLKTLAEDKHEICQKFKKENEELKEELDGSNDRTIELIDERKKIRTENKKLKEEITHKNKKFSEWIEENKELKEEVFILKMNLASAHENADVQKHNEVAGVIIEENDKLIALNEEITRKYAEYRDLSEQHLKVVKENHSKYKKEQMRKTVGREVWIETMKKNEELKKEIEELKPKANAFNDLVFENTKLEKKVEGVNEILQTETLASSVVKRFSAVLYSSDDFCDEEEECRNCGEPCDASSPEKDLCEDCHDNYNEDTGEYNSNAV